MATGNIKHTTPEMFTLTSNSSLSYSGGTGMYFPDSGLVVILGGAAHAADISTSTILGTIPQKYRPSSKKQISGRFNNSSNVNSVTGSVDINTNGTITQGATGYARSMDFWGVYQL